MAPLPEHLPRNAPQPFPHLLLTRGEQAPRPAQRLPLTCGLCVSGVARPLSEPQVSPGDPACHEARPHTRGDCRDRSPTLWPAHGQGGLGLKRFRSTAKELSAPRLRVLCLGRAAFPAVTRFQIPSGAPILGGARAGIPGGWQRGPRPTQTSERCWLGFIDSTHGQEAPSRHFALFREQGRQILLPRRPLF